MITTRNCGTKISSSILWMIGKPSKQLREYRILSAPLSIRSFHSSYHNESSSSSSSSSLSPSSVRNKVVMMEDDKALFEGLKEPPQLVDALLKRTRDMMTASSLINHTNKISSNGNSVYQHMVAFSGGVDSSLVAYLLHTNGSHVEGETRAVLGLSPAVSKEQVDMAHHVAEDIIGIPLTTVRTEEGSDPIYVENTGRACYICKTHLYQTLQAVVQHSTTSSSGIATLYNGTNGDDLMDDTRVGLLAAQEAQVLSPLSVITKDQVRIAAQHVGLPNHNAAASPCLRSRLAMGVQATQQHLQAVERAERHVRTLLQLDPSVAMRVRMLTKQRARIELESQTFDNPSTLQILNDNQLHTYFLTLGFTGGYAGVKPFKTGSVATRQPIEIWKQLASTNKNEQEKPKDDELDYQQQQVASS